ncbi:hypothetical protein_gp143 [Bacillus phage vB_BceM_WH1]|nr:hypothetical protein_gp143 [Bacillus phage vB_BceM_WH1]
MEQLVTGLYTSHEELVEAGFAFMETQLHDEVKPIHTYSKGNKVYYFVENSPGEYMFMYGLKGAVA